MKDGQEKVEYLHSAYQPGTSVIESAQAEYEALLSRRVTREEFAAGLRELKQGMDKLNIEHNNICDNDEEPGDLFP